MRRLTYIVTETVHKPHMNYELFRTMYELINQSNTDSVYEIHSLNHLYIT